MTETRPDPVVLQKVQYIAACPHGFDVLWESRRVNAGQLEVTQAVPDCCHEESA